MICLLCCVDAVLALAVVCAGCCNARDCEVPLIHICD